MRALRTFVVPTLSANCAERMGHPAEVLGQALDSELPESELRR